MAQPSIPDPIAAGQALATLNDWRAIMAVMMFVIVALIGFIVWREYSLSGLKKAIDKIADAMWALRLSIAEDRVLAREERLERKADLKEDRVSARAERALSAKERVAAKKRGG